MSLPLRKCGLKSISSVTDRSVNTVTSLAEVWIEISCKVATERVSIVTSLAEVWIEICCYEYIICCNMVTSLAEVWIEIRSARPCLQAPGHFPCGSVD